MASSRGNVHLDTAKKEQIITEFFTKSLQIILESRSSCVSSRNYGGDHTVSSPSSSSSSSSSFRSRDKWFNLALRECPADLENVDFWRQSSLEPMVVDVILVEYSVGWDPVNFFPKRDCAKNPMLKEQCPKFWNLEREELSINENIIERWVVQYESRKSKDGGGRKKSNSNLHSLYKKSIVLLRSLYATLRLLPAFKLFRDLISSGQLRAHSLTHRVSSFVKPFSRREEADMQHYSFAPVDTSCGRLCLSVSYRSILSDVRSHGSPSYSPYGRRHSWSYENYRASSPYNMPTPSPTYSDSHASLSNCKSRLHPPLSLPQHLPEPFQATTKNINYDEYWPSPVYSSSPSPPMYIARNDESKALLRCESAPVSIPLYKVFNQPTLLPSPPLKLTRAATFKQDRSADPSGSSFEKFSLGRDGSGRYSGVRMSTRSSPGISFSRCSSRPSIQDDFDDTEFACPFVVDDDDMLGSRPGSFDQKGHPNDPLKHGGSIPVQKSQDAAVGALVLMLNKAPPLQVDSVVVSKAMSCQNSEKSVLKPGDQKSQKEPAGTSTTSSSLVLSKTKANALEELRSYKELKKTLLSQGNKSKTFPDNSTEKLEREKP